jgi:hypothetical protein
MGKWVLSLLIFFLLMTNLTSMGDAQTEFSGQVSEANKKTGVGDLVIKMTPPKGSSEAQMITTTTPDGKFEFNNLKGKEYLLEVYQGPKPLYRGVVDAKQGTTKDIKVKALK